MSRYGADFRSNKGKGVVIADGFQTSSGVSEPRTVINTTITFNPPSLTTGAFAEADIAVTGVALGDSIELYPPYDMQGIMYQAAPQAADNITIALTSCSTSTVDLASGTWGVVVKRRV
jgi:hypothetical protein